MAPEKEASTGKPNSDVWHPVKITVVGDQVVNAMLAHESDNERIVGHEAVVLASPTAAMDVKVGHRLNTHAETINVLGTVRCLTKPLTTSGCFLRCWISFLPLRSSFSAASWPMA